jgi:hypothetical protein
MKTALLFTDNATIKKLFSLSLEKMGMQLIEGDIDNPEQNADIIFIDNSIYSDELMQKLPESTKKILILGKNEEKKDGFYEYMHKPFLPTDLIDLINKIANAPATEEDKSVNNILDDLEENDDLDFDDIGLDDNESAENNNLDDLDLNDMNFDEEENNESDNNDMAIEEDALDDINFDEDSKKEELKDEDMNLEELDNELEGIDEKSVAEAIGEEIPELEDTNDDTANIEEEPSNDIIEEPEVVDEAQTIEKNEELPEIPTKAEKVEEPAKQTTNNQESEHTVNSLLNLNIEALKNSGATLTITIKFDKE